jgi:hypothetical protein
MRRRTFLSLLLAAPASVNAAPALWTGLQGDSRPADTFAFIAIGDMGTGDSAQMSVAAAITTHHNTHPFDTALTLGDNIYPDGNPRLFKEKFEVPYAELLKRGVRFYASLGNHDVRRGRDAELKYPNFNMDGRPYYSFVKADDLIEFFALDSTSFDSQQRSWLDGALGASKARWKVAYYHHPIYSSGMTHGSDMKLRSQIEPLFVKHGVVASLSGHDHTYERTKLQQGVQYFVCGTGGQLRKGDLNRQSPFFNVGNDRVNSFMYFEARPDSLSFWALDPAGNTLDSGALSHVRAAGKG